MEPNGCVASLMPDHAFIDEKEKWVAGSAKDDYPQADPVRKLPAKLISPEEGELVWCLDKAATSKLFKEKIHFNKRSPSVNN